MWYNENWHKEVSSVDVVDKSWRDIAWVKEEDIRKQAIEYLNREENRKLPPHEFNSLVFKVKEYLRKVDSDRSIIDHKFEWLRRWIVAEIRASKNTLRREIDSRNIDEISKIRSPWDLSRYIDQSWDKALDTLRKELWEKTVLNMISYWFLYTSIELGKWFADILKFWEEFKKMEDDLKNWDFMIKDKFKLILKTFWIEWLRILALIPWWKLALAKLWQLTKETKIVNIMKPLSNNRWNIILRDWWNVLKESEEVYSKYPVLKKHKEFLWELEHKDILWTWNNAIIVRHPTKDNMVVKVAKEWKVDNIEMEYDNHQNFFDVLQEWITEYKWKISQEIRIPGIERVWNNEWIFIMEKIEWQNLTTRFYREYYSADLSKHPKKLLDSLNDKQFEVLMDKEKLRKVPIMQFEWDFSWKILSKEMKDFLRKHTHWTELWNTLDFLEWKWLRHNDLHPWNIMIDNKGNTYIIDFWRVLIRK